MHRDYTHRALSQELMKSLDAHLGILVRDSALEELSGLVNRFPVANVRNHFISIISETLHILICPSDLRITATLKNAESRWG